MRQTITQSADVQRAFAETYHKDPDRITFTPYRICPLGAHCDHQLGDVTGFAIDKGIRFAYAPDPSGRIRVRSLQYEPCAEWDLAEIPGTKQGDWADHLRGAAAALARRFPLTVGLYGVVGGELPVGGLSSSAAVILAFLRALCALNGIRLSPKEQIETAREAENRYVGVSCGKLDQSCIVYSRKDRLLYLDLKEDSCEQIAPGAGMKESVILIFFSGLERSLASSRYNLRVDECRSAAYSLMAYAGMEYGTYAETYLRDVPYECFLAYRDRLPEPFCRRAAHFYSEQQRVRLGADAWRRGDLEAFGQLCFASGRSSIQNWEAGSPELIRLHEILERTGGVYGGRFSGAGFKGCCMAIADPDAAEKILADVEDEYLRAFPEREDRYTACICRTTDGVGTR